MWFRNFEIGWPLMKSSRDTAQRPLNSEVEAASQTSSPSGSPRPLGRRWFHTKLKSARCQLRGAPNHQEMVIEMRWALYIITWITGELARPSSYWDWRVSWASEIQRNLFSGVFQLWQVETWKLYWIMPWFIFILDRFFFSGHTLAKHTAMILQ